MKYSQKTLLMLLLVVLAVGARLAAAAEHPVKLEKDADCATCHEEKTKGKAVHTAIAMGCTTCHDVKTEGETTTVTLTSPKEKLCLTCHDQAKEQVKHGPYEQGKCVTCHDPHTSDYPNQLRAALNANFCLECHGPRKDVGEKITLFKSQEWTRDQFNEAPKIFLSADLTHDHPVDKHPTANIPNPMKPQEKLSCTSCHMTHASSQEKLLLAPDKEGRDVCTQCHLVVDSSKESAALKEGQSLEAQRIEKLRKINPDAGKTPKKNHAGDQE